jgi:uncharacterized protein (TIGR03437 family)
MRLFGSSVELFVLALAFTSTNVGRSQTAKPTVTAVTNVASYANGSISPGEMVVIFGSGMGPSSVFLSQLDQQGRIANALSQVQVLFDGTPAPLIYVSAKQISAMVPYGLAGKTSTQIQVVYQGSTSDSFQKPIAPSAPGLFTSDSSGQGQVAMANSDGSYNAASNPAIPGSYVTFYLTGEGQTNPLGSDGNIATPTANVALPVTVLIAGRTVQLLYAGSAPGNVNGFAQINVVIPADLQYGGNLPLVVLIGGVASQSGVTLAVSGPPAPMPGTPHSLSSSSNASGQFVLTWTPADGLAARFHVERQIGGTGAFTEIAVVPVPATSFTDMGVTAGVSYQYRVRAENDYGFSAYSTVATGTVPAATLTPPSNVQAVPASQTQVNLTWSTANTNATKFHIERKSGVTGIYAEITAIPSTANSYQDTTVQPSSTYTYRMRSEGATGGLSSYSSETSATTPALPLPLAPTLQGTATSSSQIHLSWTVTATGIVRFRVERRTSTGAYSEISQPGATNTSVDDFGLAASTAYLYRMRVETGAGISAYSSEVTATTLALPLPPAPTLQGAATSSSQVHLSWTSTATGIIRFRLERRTTSGAYSEISQPSAFSTSVDDSGLTASTDYLYRVRVEMSAGISPYSNEVTATTLQLAIPQTVFLIHGLDQGPLDMRNLALHLESSYGLTPGRFKVDYNFDFSDCADKALFCSANCTIPGGAQRLAQYIVNANPPGDIVLIGFSLGGLIARDMIVNNRIILSGRKINLVTIGTPNLGYPYLATDSLVFCSAIVSAMDGNWRKQPGSVVLSNYLISLTNQWSAYGFPGSGRTWLAASGRACNIPTRLSTGCRDQTYSDGVVCQDSAAYNVSTPAGTQPNYSWADPNGVYVHSFSGFTSLILCNTSDQTKYLPLYDPPPTGGLFVYLTAVLNGM